MAISVNWATKIVTIPKADLTLISGTIYEADTDDVRLELKALESSEEGMPYLDITQHNTEVSVAGVTYARVIEIINGYQIQFEDGQYTVILKGSNNNIFDVENGVLVQNQVQVIPTNSAGLQTVVSGSGVTEQDKVDISNKVRDITIDNSASGITLQKSLFAILAALSGIADGGGTTEITFRNQGDTADALVMTVDEDGNRTVTTIGTP